MSEYEAYWLTDFLLIHNWACAKKESANKTSIRKISTVKPRGHLPYPRLVALLLKTSLMRPFNKLALLLRVSKS